MSPIYLFTLCLLLGAAALAVARGGPWERGVAVALILGWIVSAIAPFDHRSPPWIAIGVDGAILLFLLYGVLRSDRRWLRAAAACQCLVLATHHAFIMNRGLEQWAYISAYYVWNIGLIGSLLAGSLLRKRSDPAGPARATRNGAP